MRIRSFRAHPFPVSPVLFPIGVRFTEDGGTDITPMEHLLSPTAPFPGFYSLFFSFSLLSSFWLASISFQLFYAVIILDPVLGNAWARSVLFSATKCPLSTFLVVGRRKGTRRQEGTLSQSSLAPLMQKIYARICPIFVSAPPCSWNAPRRDCS